MQNVSQNFIDIWNRGGAQIEYTAIINDIIYTFEDIFAGSIQAALFSDGYSVGNVITKTLNLTVLKKSDIPRASKILIQLRIKDEYDTSEYINRGTYYIDNRRNFDGNKTIFTCYDKIMLLDVPFMSEGDVGEWPRKTTEVLNEITDRVGILHNINIENDYNVEYPNDMTMREILSQIATMQGGNIWIDFDDVMQLEYPIASNIVTQLSRNYKGKQNLQDVQISMVNLDDETNNWIAGDDTYDTLYATALWATQEVADNVLNRVKNQIIRGYRINSLLTMPNISLNDVFHDEDDYIVNKLSFAITPAPIFNIESPASEIDIESEFSTYEGEFSRQMKNAVKTTQTYYGTSITRAHGIVIERADGLSKATFNSDVFMMEALRDGVMVPSIYFDPVLQKYRITGQVEIDGSLIAQTIIVNNLYATNARIADLTVNRLRTDYEKISNWLKDDQKDINYIDIYEDKHYMISAKSTGNTIQFTTMSGELLYWESEDYVRMTTDETDYPVWVFEYEETIGYSNVFQDVDGSVFPIVTFGAGENLMGKARMFKENGFVIEYNSATTDGLKAMLEFRDDGKIYYNGKEICTDCSGGGTGTPSDFAQWGQVKNGVVNRIVIEEA